jgi:hypothetical protein
VTRSIGDATDASLHGGHAEVHQQPKAQVHDLQVGEQLARKHRVQRPSGFDFDNDSLVDDQIRPKSVLECWCMRTPAATTAPLITFRSSTPCAPVLSVPLCENDGAMMHDNVGHWNGWRGRGGQYVTELPNQTT